MINDNRKLPPKILIKATAEHDESREVLKEFEPYQQAVYANDIHVWSDGYISNNRYLDHFAINYDHINNYYSEWKRVDEGGGKISGKQGNGDSINKFVEDVIDEKDSMIDIRREFFEEQLNYKKKMTDTANGKIYQDFIESLLLGKA